MGDIGSDERLIELAGKNGFQAVDVDVRGLVERNSVEKVKELLEQNGLVIGNFGFGVEWRASEEKFKEGLAKLAQAAAAAQAVGAKNCCTYILPSTDLKAAHFMALATRRLRTCAQILDAFGLRLGLEFVGPHHLRTKWANPFIWTVDETLDWIDAIGQSNVGLLYDSFHWYTNGLTVADIEKLDVNQIVHVHINDAPEGPVEEALDNGRVYPGEGVIDLAGFLKGLNNIGYTGAVSQEILSQTKPTDSPEVLAQRSKVCFDKVFGAAGL
jgi:sugar phosphate isomerase/epimerase